MRRLPNWRCDHHQSLPAACQVSNSRQSIAPRAHSRAVVQACNSHRRTAVESQIPNSCRECSARLLQVHFPRARVLITHVRVVSPCRRSLEVLKDANLTSIGFPVVNTERKLYPKKQAAHIAVRELALRALRIVQDVHSQTTGTIRRFLEAHGSTIQTVVLAIDTQNDWDIYQVRHFANRLARTLSRSPRNAFAGGVAAVFPAPPG